MQTTTWHVDIELSDDGDEVTAVAKLRADESSSAPSIGLGAVHHDDLDRDPAPEFALAARRSLESLSTALGYYSHSEQYADTDQA
jgi:hypothetical protein